MASFFWTTRYIYIYIYIVAVIVLTSMMRFFRRTFIVSFEFLKPVTSYFYHLFFNLLPAVDLKCIKLINSLMID